MLGLSVDLALGTHNAILKRVRDAHARRSSYAIVHLTASGVKYSTQLLLMN